MKEVDYKLLKGGFEGEYESFYKEKPYLYVMEMLYYRITMDPLKFR